MIFCNLQTVVIKGVRKVRKFLYASCLKILVLLITTVLSLCGDEKVLQYYVIFMQPTVRVFLFFFFFSATLLSITMLLMLII